jgi:hypothetical protein
MPFYKCSHGADPHKCVEPLCRNWNQLAKDDIRSLFGQQSSSLLASRLMRERPDEYRRLRRLAMEQNLIPMETIPVSLRPDED